MTFSYTARPLDERATPSRIVEGYAQTRVRTPAEPLIRRAPTLGELTAPAGLERRLALLGADMAGQGAARAQGLLIELRVTVVDEDGSPLPGAVVEVWQANAAGRYVHPNDDDHAPIDPNFYGAARLLTGADGRFTLRTVQPGAYPVPNTGGWWRPAHIHFSVWGRVWLSRLVTQMYFPGDPLLAQDRIFLSVPDADARSRLVCGLVPPMQGRPDALVYEHRIVVRGSAATPTQD